VNIIQKKLFLHDIVYFLPPTNGNLYHYAGNNPIKYTDPDGRNHGIPAEIQKILDKQNLKNNIKNKVNDISKTIGKIASRAVADEK